MFVSTKRIEANRLNAQMSTGPKTEAGKERSRANALTHGLCATVVNAEDPKLVQTRATEFFGSLRPQNAYQAWMVNEAAIASVRIDRCERMERRTRDKICLRAELTWDDDRDFEAEVLGSSISVQPAETVLALRRTPHGCDWLMNRWAFLAHAALNNLGKTWTEEQSAHAFDLMGTPAMFRAGNKPGGVIDRDGNVLVKADEQVAVARRTIAELERRRDVVAGLDAAERTLVEVDLNHDSDPELRRIRRYESALHTRLRWTVGQGTGDTVNRPPITHLWPEWIDKPNQVPTPKPEPKSADEIAAEKHPADSFSPPFCLAPDEFPPIGQKADIPAILKSRKAKKLQKEYAKREARRRKAETLRS